MRHWIKKLDFPTSTILFCMSIFIYFLSWHLNVRTKINTFEEKRFYYRYLGWYGMHKAEPSSKKISFVLSVNINTNGPDLDHNTVNTGK
jgi:hypothetical protein